MSGSERLDPKSGSLGNSSQAYFGGLENVMKGYEPALRGLARWNLEAFGLASRRAQAWFEIPARLGNCRTPQDLVKEQMRFWQSAAQDYMEGAQRLTTALGALGVPTLNGAWGGNAVAQQRDYITFPEAKPAAETPKRDRRAA